MADKINRMWILTERPTGKPSLENFELRQRAIPEPDPGEVLVRTLYMSVDPYMRSRMQKSIPQYDSWETDEPMRARVVGEVIESKCDALNSGEIVIGNLYWAEYTTADGETLNTVETGEAPVSTALHILGTPGLTAYIGMVEIGQVKPGDTVIVSGAAGAVGSVAGQIARIAGCRVVGIAGSEKKTTWLTDELGYDAAVNYRTTNNLSQAVTEACSRGVDVYFENVGGEVSDAVMDHLNNYSRVAVCGKISLYNLESDDDRMNGTRRFYQRTRTRVEGFVARDYNHLVDVATERLSRWIREDEVRYEETVADGIENAPEAFLGLFEGENIGKQLVKVG